MFAKWFKKNGWGKWGKWAYIIVPMYYFVMTLFVVPFIIFPLAIVYALSDTGKKYCELNHYRR